MTLLRIEGSDPCDFALRFRLAAVLRGRETREPSPVRLNVRYEAGPLVGGLTMRLGAGQLPPCLLGRHPTELPSCKQRTGPVRHLLVWALPNLFCGRQAFGRTSLPWIACSIPHSNFACTYADVLMCINSVSPPGVCIVSLLDVVCDEHCRRKGVPNAYGQGEGREQAAVCSATVYSWS